MKQGDHIFLVDGSGYIFRAYHALPPLTRKSDGLPCGAVAGFCNMLWKLVCEARNGRQGAPAQRGLAADAGALGSAAKKGKAAALLAPPTHFAVVFDYSSQTFRKEIYPEYKANRPPPPADLIPQFALIRAATRAFGLPSIEKQGYEADDIIATYAKRAEAMGARVTIVSSDKDLMQLVGPQISLYDTMKETITGRAEVVAKWGVPPEKMVDFQALVGDAADNVPGVAGIGPKTAAELLNRFGSLAAVLERADEITQKKRRESLKEQADKARLSRRLVELCLSVPLADDLESLALLPPDGVKLVRFLKAMEFNSLTRRVAKMLDIDADAVEPDYVAVEWSAAAADGAHGPDMPEKAGLAGAAHAAGAGEAAGKGAGAAGGGADLFARPRAAFGASAVSAYDNPAAAPRLLAEKKAEEAKIGKIDRSAYKILRHGEELAEWFDKARNQGFMAFAAQADLPNAFAAELVGFSLALSPSEAAYVPLGHRARGREGGARQENSARGWGGGARQAEQADLLGDAPLQEGQIDKAAALALLKPVLEDDAVLKIGRAVKEDCRLMARSGLNMRGFDDVTLMSYVCQAGAAANHGLEALAAQWLGHSAMPYAEICGAGKNAVSFAEADLARAADYAAEEADVTLRLWAALKPRLSALGLSAVYEREERPLVSVLGAMEQRGVLVDKALLAKLSARFGGEAAARARAIYALAGEEFNIASPKQLGEILFGKFALPGGKKTKTGQWATAAQALEDLAARAALSAAEREEAGQNNAAADFDAFAAQRERGYALAGKIIAWRQLQKLQSTYTDALPHFQDRQGRVHTHYAQAATTTGRLASSEPNLQNIPIRTQEGRLIRAAFIAPPGKLLLSADYSQIELRVLAHAADIGALKKAFAAGTDIHAMTASEMFDVPLSEMTPEIRRRAKAINFGIIYGISAFGLANQLGIGREEAGRYIQTYFERFPGIRAYMEETKAFARAHGYVETIFGRRIHYPEIESRNAQLRSFNERAAINAPIQGAAADIIRRAMIKMEAALAEKLPACQMLLQVHDELIFEVTETEAEAAAALVRDIMENAAFPAVNLSVPLRVEARFAKNWDDAH